MYILDILINLNYLVSWLNEQKIYFIQTLILYLCECSYVAPACYEAKIHPPRRKVVRGNENSQTIPGSYLHLKYFVYKINRWNAEMVFLKGRRPP